MHGSGSLDDAVFANGLQELEWERFAEWKEGHYRAAANEDGGRIHHLLWQYSLLVPFMRSNMIRIRERESESLLV